MSTTEITKQAADKLEERYGKAMLGRVPFRGDETLTFSLNEIHDVIRWTRDALGFNMLVDLCSVDNFGSSPRFEIVYTLTQAETGANITLKASLNEDDEVDSVTDLFEAANWHEREAWDLMGIRFKNHPDLRRILMWEGYPYHPLRKDFPLEGLPTELEGVAFSEPVPMEGGPFATVPGSGTASDREPRSTEKI